jgi:hypothetical protein
MHDLRSTLDDDPPEASLVVEIDQWDWNLHVGLSSDLTPKKYRFQGGLAYTRSIYIEGRVLSPTAYQDTRVQLWIMPIGPERRRFADERDNAGQVHLRRDKAGDAQLVATLISSPEELPSTLASLRSIYRFVHIWTMDAENDQAWVHDFALSPHGRIPGPLVDKAR